MTIYNLYNLLKEELGNGSSDLVTRPSGNKIRERIERDISEKLGLEPNASGMRLLNLYKKRLVKRGEAIQDGGKVWAYESI